ncbi:MAG: serine/threonine protein kinase, partial [Nannocystaceae bacterium]|nr:serine/threonine protein kinase [Nannocystaceae bacterium]
MPDPDDRLSRFMTEFGPQRDVESRRVLSKLRQQLFERGESAKVSRFEQLERIGHGGMGVVYRAWDPILRRRVAIKLLHPRVSDSSRVLAEARALAAMSHPNIVQVLDVGRERNELFVVMEYVGGKTLSDLLGAKRSLSSLAPLFQQVAEGLTAAHARGVVHHDIKPSNVLISSADVAQIADFGLARLMHADNHSPGGGTRGYAAPEQVAGLRSDARADVFSLTAIVYAAIYGSPPSISASSSIDLPSGPAISARMQRFLRAGLTPDPADRLASAEAWSTAFQRALRSPLRSLLPGVLGVAGVAALVVSSIASRGDPVCDSRGKPWNENLRAQAEASFINTGLPFAPEEFKRADGRITDASNRWALARQEACAAGNAVALACTDARRAGLDELISWTLELEASEVEHVADALRGLPDPSTCLSPEAVPPPEELRDFDVSLARAHTLTDVGRYADAIETLRETPLPDGTRRFANRLAMHAFALARALKLSGDYEAAAVEFEKGYLLDLLGGQGRIAGPAAAQLAALHASELSDPGAGRRWIRNAQTAIARGHNPGAAVRGRVEVGLAATRYALGEFEQALVSLEAADASLAKDDVIRIDWGTLLAGIRYQQGDAAGALKA